MKWLFTADLKEECEAACPPKAAYICNVSPAFTATNWWEPELQ